MRLLIVEDNPALAELLTSAFAKAGFPCDRAANAADAEALMSVARYAAIVLDLNLPDDDGLALLRRRRDKGDATPVLILTARAGVSDRVTGLRTGADDYVVKPFAFDELLARVEALLRRPGQFSDAQLTLGRLAFDTQTRRTTVEGQLLTLPARELELLEVLLRRQGQVVSREVVESQLFGSEQLISSNALEVCVHRLRRRLETAEPSLEIITLRGIGYLLRARPG